jgi:adenylate cyclase
MVDEVETLNTARNTARPTTEPDADEPAARLYEAVRLGAPRYTRADVARIAGIDRERSVKWWRAMGFPEVPEDTPAFTDVDVEIVRRLAALSGAGLVDDTEILRLARLLGASFTRIVEAQLAVVEQLVEAVPSSDRSSSTDGTDPAVVADVIDESIVALLEDSVDYVWRRHLLAALVRLLETDETATEAAVGFADLSGFTKLTQRMEVERLTELVDDFEDSAFDVVSARGGRTVKLIGDEVMFVARTLSVAVDIALDLADRLHAIPDMPEIHCGIAYGPTASLGGDVFGPAVNLAARLTTLARRGTIVIPRAAVAQIADRDDIEVIRVRRAFDLKGIGDTRIVAVRRRVRP